MTTPISSAAAAEVAIDSGIWAAIIFAFCPRWSQEVGHLISPLPLSHIITSVFSHFHFFLYFSMHSFCAFLFLFPGCRTLLGNPRAQCPVRLATQGPSCPLGPTPPLSVYQGPKLSPGQVGESHRGRQQCKPASRISTPLPPFHFSLTLLLVTWTMSECSSWNIFMIKYVVV